jgi:hypothetical protein
MENENLNKLVSTIINKLFPKLNVTDVMLLQKYLYLLICLVILTFEKSINTINVEIFIKKFTDNDYSDGLWLLTFLLPFINSETENITSLQEIIIQKKKDVNINDEEPTYVYSKIQYGRFFRNKNNYTEFTNINDYIHQNFLLLVNTIKTSSNKLFPNWINILPYSLTDYRNSKLFNDSFIKFISRSLDDWSPENINDTDTLQILRDKLNITLDMNDIYNTISVELYHNIKDIKWLIFDIYFKGKFTPLIIILDYMFDLSFLLSIHGVEWIQISDDKRKSFTKIYEKIIQNLVDGNIQLNDDILSHDSYIILVTAIKKAFNGSVILQTAKKNGFNGDFKTLKVEYFYEFIRNSIKKITNTWYGFKLLNENKTNFTEIIFKNSFTLKNVFNMAKSIVHDDKFKLLPNHWCSLEMSQKEKFLDKINLKYTSWFNIRKELQKLKYDIYLHMDVNELNNKILLNVRNALVLFIFESLITRGVLTHYNYSDENVFNKSGDIWNAGYHFLTGIPYKHMNKFSNAEKDKENSELIDIFDYYKKRKWYNATAVSWIGQLGFCHKFINNRIIMITGATGAGKSTQIPKLCLYFLKAIDYNAIGKIVCSEPRIIATKKNAITVSQELGVPISEFQNYFVQYKFKGVDGRHTDPREPIMLRFETDGTLLMEIHDPTLKKKKNNQYINNIYDVIMIDESHEHNVNMDIIMSLLKKSLMLNNSVRMVILSATMDEDEHRYRRFYRDINDNKKYPLDLWIAENKIDRINTDRRFHISPPKVTTRFQITEIYKPTGNVTEIINNIISSSSTGYVLVFQSGVKEINKLVKTLNDISPSDVIAVPCYSEIMNRDSLIKFYENIKDYVKYIKCDKKIVFADAVYNIDNIIGEKPTNLYNRVIIVGTNVVEASVTIPGLKYIVDDGKNKVERYDYKTRSDTLIEEDISESSRIQRRGRVGRTEDGTVFYLYEKDKMTNNKKSYEISNKNICLQMYKELETVNSKEIIKIDPNYYLTKIDDISKFNTNQQNILSSYFVSSKYYNYYGNDKYYDYVNCEIINSYSDDGCNYDTLSDKYGNFYIIHPDETYLFRNINGEIINTKNSSHVTINEDSNKKKYITSNKLISFWSILDNYLYLNNDKRKSSIGETIMKMFNLLDIDDHNIVRTIYFGHVLNCSSDIINLCAMLEILNYDVSKILNISRTSARINYSNKDDVFYHNVVKIKNISNKVTQYDNDSEYIIDILKSFDTFLTRNHIPISITSQDLLKIYSKEKNSGIGSVTNVIETLSNIKSDVDEEREEFKYRLQNMVFRDLDDFVNKSMIPRWCLDFYNIDPKIMKLYLTKRAKFNQMIHDNFSDDIIKNINDMRNVIIDKSTNQIKLTILLSYPLNIVKLITKEDNNYYLSVYNVDIHNIFSINKFNKFRSPPAVYKDVTFKHFDFNTFVNDSYLSNYILYLNEKIGKTISILHCVTPKELRCLSYIYNLKFINEIKIDRKSITEYVNEKMDCETVKCSFENKILVATLSNYVSTINEIKRDLSKVYDSNLHKLISKNLKI